MDTLTSVSKGCFVVPPSKKDKKPARLKSRKYLANDEKSTKLRWGMAEKIWAAMNNKIKSLHAELTSKIFNDLLQFLQKSSFDNIAENSGKRAEIPTAALITGVNMPDHTELFCQFTNKVKKCITPHVAVLCAKNCPNMKSLMRCIGQQLILGEGSDALNVSVDDTEVDFQHDEKAISDIWRKSTPFTMSILEKWYSQANHELEMKTPKKKKKQNSNKSPVIIMLRDLESFASQLLQDLITMLSTLVTRVPVILVFGVATSWSSVVDRQLPHSATVHLGLEKFYSPSASQHLAIIIDEILLTPEHPFKLSGKCLQLLLDIFLCHDFSVTNFLTILKFCVLEHFYEKPSSAFCMVNLDNMEERLCKASHEDLLHLRSLPSLKRFLHSLTTSRKENLESNDDEFKIVIHNMLRFIHQFHLCFFSVMRCLFSLCKSLPRHPLGRQIRELYCACSHSKITETEDYKQAKLFLRVSSRDQLVQRLRSCIIELEIVDQNPTKSATEEKENSSNFLVLVHNTKSEIEKIIEDLVHLEDLQEEEDENEEENNENGEKEEKPLEKVKYAYQLQEKLKTRSKQKKFRKMTKFEKLRMKALDVLDQLFRTVLLPPRSFPLHEVFYFDSPATVKRHAAAAPRVAIQTALSDPNYYLQQPCLQSASDGIIPPSAPDLCIAYKLHNECGRIINLYDWMEAFHTIVNAPAEEDDDEADNRQIEEINELTQARFIRAASELQFLGFVKPTKRKTDHVQRLTWSHS